MPAFGAENPKMEDGREIVVLVQLTSADRASETIQYAHPHLRP
jgi:hypothetical protein